MTASELRKLRASLGLSQRDLGLAVYLKGKYPGRHISRLESGKKPITGPIERALEAVAEKAGVAVR